MQRAWRPSSPGCSHALLRGRGASAECVCLAGEPPRDFGAWAAGTRPDPSPGRPQLLRPGAGRPLQLVPPLNASPRPHARPQAAQQPQPLPEKRPSAHWGFELDGLDFFETLVPNAQ